jgi:hypothetical protein
MGRQQDKEFQKLKKLWYKKAEKSGFVDIEQDEYNLKIWTGHRIKAKYTPDSYLAKQEYFIMAGQFLYEHDFDSKLERTVWAYHAEGKSVPEILKELRKKRVKVTPDPLHRMIQRLSAEMLKCLTKKT